MKMTKIHEVANLGQSIWLDYMSRSLIVSGELKNLVDKGLRGVTSNPSIFEKAIDSSSDYDEDIKKLASKSVDEIYESLIIEDISKAADVLRSVYDTSKGLDGYVSLEVSPKLAYDTDGTIADARRLFKALNRPNIFIKVPATKEGAPAIETLISEGININVTLIFSMSHYEAIAEAYIAGLEKLSAKGGDINKAVSVASFFVSRIDTVVDQALKDKKELQGKTAIACAKMIYARFCEIFNDERWKRLSAKGARVQRPLWGSTGAKNPNYPDTLYIDSLIGSDTVNTIPMNTLNAFLDHGVVASTLESSLNDAKILLKSLPNLSIDLDVITEQLQIKGVDSFAESFDTLMASIAKKKESFLETGK